MKKNAHLVTVGLCPCWDTFCNINGVNWNEHKIIDSQTSRPAGKALNVSQALNWMGQKNIAAGLWGKNDYHQMLAALRPQKKLLAAKFTSVPGQTRRNITLIDTLKNREIHLRAKSSLASKTALKKLRQDLAHIIKPRTVCVFSGSLPQGPLLSDVVSIIKFAQNAGAAVVLDSSSQGLKKITNAPKPNKLLLIKPNVQELSELLGQPIPDNVRALIKAGRKLLSKTHILLITRGKKGAILIAENFCLKADIQNNRKAATTVGCGDYLLAGFLKGLKEKQDLKFALQTAVKAATAKAWGLADSITFQQAEKKVKVRIRTS